MQVRGICARCNGRLAVLDILTEGYDLICMRCGMREITNYQLTEPPPCFQ
jgi:hypothetical protein